MLPKPLKKVVLQHCALTLSRNERAQAIWLRHQELAFPCEPSSFLASKYFESFFSVGPFGFQLYGLGQFLAQSFGFWI